MPGLGASYGRGGATNPTMDLQHSDCILIMGSNMAECHPVAFRFVVDAKTRLENPCTVIHADPRFTRTSALANLYAPVRAGSDIVFLGALVKYALDRLARLITSENGKSDADARAEVGYAAEFFRWFSEEAVRTDGAYGPSPAGGTRTIVTHKPVGVAALVTPWNFPAAMATRKIAPALAAGCTVVLKPAAETPLTALAISGILAVLFGLQSYAQLNRMPYIRNGGSGYRYVVLEYVAFNNPNLRPVPPLAAAVPY